MKLVQRKKRIRDLAKEWLVGSKKIPIDEWAEKVTALNDEAVKSDDVEMLIINLRRVGYPDGVELTKLHARYLEETG